MKIIKKTFLVVLSFIFMFLLSSCDLIKKTSETGTTTKKKVSEERIYDKDLNIVNDNYRNYYEIFVWSYADSDGDGIGDFNGITSKLDYIKDMGFNGIWLMPINSATSYHKYDVVNYYTVDQQFGTLAEFVNLVNKCHEKGIKLIMDLVVNHTAEAHPWFQSALNYLRQNGEPGGEYGDYYNFTTQYSSGYTAISNTFYYYEAQFWSGMPDLNLDSENVRNEIKNIMYYWLDLGVDGFRLDAVTSYYTNNVNKNVEFLSWLNDTVKAKKSDAYIVGEAWINSYSGVRSYYNSSVDSFFLFPIATGDGSLIKVLNDSKTNNGQEYGNLLNILSSTYDKGILAPFLSNHDTNRIVGFVGRKNVEKIKMINGLMSLMNGSTFVYYGEEIGMICSNASSDPEKRIAMYWNKDRTGEFCKTVPSGAAAYRDNTYYFGSVEEQLADSTSILRYYQYCNYLRNCNPEIARGTTRVYDSYYSQSQYVTVMTKEYNGQKITIVVNLSKSNTVDLTLSRTELGYTDLYQYLCTDPSYTVTYNKSNNKITLPPYSIAILR